MALRDWFWILLLGIIWGFSFPLNAILLNELTPLWIAAGRVTIGAIASLIFLLILKKQFPLDLILILKIFLLGIISYAIPFALFPLAQIHLASGVASILNAMTPITTVIVSHFWIGGEKATWTKAFGIGAGFIGATFLALPALQTGGNSQIWAIGLALLATLCYATSLNYTKINLPKIDATILATIALIGASFGAIIIALIFDEIPTITKTNTWIALFTIGLVATAFAFQIMYRILPRIGATNLTITTFIAPISAIILGASLLGEELHLSHYLGMLFIFLGLLMIDGRISKRLRQIKIK